MKKILAVCAVLLTTCAFAQDKTQQYLDERERIFVQREAGKLTPVETAIELEAAGKAYFPNDSLLHAYNASIREYTERHQRGEITRERYLELTEQRQERFDKAIEARAAASAGTQQAEAPGAGPSRAGPAIGVFLQGMAQSMNRNFPRSTTCTSAGVPGAITTTCR